MPHNTLASVLLTTFLLFSSAALLGHLHRVRMISHMHCKYVVLPTQFNEVVLSTRTL